MLHFLKIFILVLISFLLLTVNIVFALRCGTNLIEIGDRRFEVLKKCKEPISKDIVGYTTGKNKNRELKIEEWIYGPIGGYYYYLIFKGGILAEINAVRD